jgi:hypothetical protein
MRTQSDQAKLDAMTQKQKLAKTTYRAFHERGNVLYHRIGTHFGRKKVCMYVTRNEMPQVDREGKKVLEHHTMRFVDEIQHRIFWGEVFLY